MIPYDRNADLMVAIRRVALSLERYDHYKRMEVLPKTFTPPEMIEMAKATLNDSIQILVDEVGAIIGDQDKGVREDVDSAGPIQE
jgi:hypothetical protein